MSKTCSVEGCNSKHFGLGYCSRHYMQIRRNGEIISIDRTMYDPNEIVIYEDYAEIILYNNRGMEKARALIDLDDIERVSQYKWHLDGKGYVVGTNKIKLHRLIMNVWQEEFNRSINVIDHINRNPLDNRKSNLRIVSQAENNRNKSDNKKVIAIIDNKPFMIFDTQIEGAKYFGIKGRGVNIGRCCKGEKNHKTCGKYNGKKIVWKYLFTEEL